MAYGAVDRPTKNPDWGRKAKWRKLRARVYIAYDFTCQGCGWRPSPIPEPYTGRSTVIGKKDGEWTYLQMDHIVPRSKGGGNEFMNFQPLCHSCNARKRDHV